MNSSDLSAFANQLHAVVDKLTAPHVLFRPGITEHRGTFYAHYGTFSRIDIEGNIHFSSGVVGSGKTAGEACLAFDRAWRQGNG